MSDIFNSFYSFLWSGLGGIGFFGCILWIYQRLKAYYFLGRNFRIFPDYKLQKRSIRDILWLCLFGIIIISAAFLLIKRGWSDDRKILVCFSSLFLSKFLNKNQGWYWGWNSSKIFYNEKGIIVDCIDNLRKKYHYIKREDIEAITWQEVSGGWKGRLHLKPDNKLTSFIIRDDEKDIYREILDISD